MSSPYAGNSANYPANIDCPVDTDPPNASATTTPLQELADRTAYIVAHYAAMAIANTWTALQSFAKGITVTADDGVVPVVATGNAGGDNDAVHGNGSGAGNGVVGASGQAGGALSAGVRGVGLVAGVAPTDGGYGGSFGGNAFRAALHLDPQALPSLAQAGDLVVTSVGNFLKAYVTGSWRTVAMLELAQVFTKKQIVNAAGGTNDNAIEANGDGTGAGIEGTGGATNGIGVRGQGIGNGAGVRGDGDPASTGPGGAFFGGGTNGVGCQATGHGSGQGGLFVGGGSAEGVNATGGGTNPGAICTGGAGGAVGCEGVGTGNSPGVTGLGAGTGAGVRGSGGASGHGVHGSSGATAGSGVYGITNNSSKAGGMFEGSVSKAALNLVPQSGVVSGGFPAVADLGDIFFNSTDNHFYGYTGAGPHSGWAQLDN